MLDTVLLEAKGITKTFPGVKALDEVDFSLRQGEVHAIVGENGAGKTTLMLTLGGVYRPDAGAIYMEGEELSCSSPHEANLKGISIVYQELSLIPSLSIAENIYANRQPIKRLNFIDRKKMYEDASEMLALFGLDCFDPATPINQLSIANQQIVEILKAISINPKVLILDEPTSSLTEPEIKQLFSNIKILKEKGYSFIYISHHLSEIFEIADRVTVLRDGKTVCEQMVKDIDEDFLITNMVGRTIVNMYGQRNQDEKIMGEVFSVKNFTSKKIGIKRAFTDVSFSLKAGEIVGMAGLVGAGRSETARAIMGVDPKERGEVFLDGQKVNIRTPKDAIKRGIGYLSEDRKTQGLITKFNVRDNLVSNHLEDFTTSYGKINNRSINQFSQTTKDNFKIATPSIYQVVENLSGGNQQKVLLGMWFGIDPKVLIVDEPTRGVDVGVKSDIYQQLRALAGRGVAILVISSDLPEILGISDRIIVMQNGRIVGELPGQGATEESVISLAAKAVNGGECD